MGRSFVEPLPEFGIEMETHALLAADREWVPLMRTKYMRMKFSSFDQAEEFVSTMKQAQPHVALRIDPLG